MKSGFELQGTEDETRSVVHRATGFSLAIPGHPVVRASETRACELLLSDAAIEVTLRMDNVPGTLAASLALGQHRGAERANRKRAHRPRP